MSGAPDLSPLYPESSPLSTPTFYGMARSELALKAKGITMLGGVPVEDALVVSAAEGLKRLEDDWQRTLQERT